MACDSFDSLLDRMFSRSKPGDVLFVDGEAGQWDLKITRTETGISIYQTEWYPAMGGREWTEDYDEAAARAHLRQSYGFNADNPGRLKLEDTFPQIVDEEL